MGTTVLETPEQAAKYRTSRTSAKEAAVSGEVKTGAQLVDFWKQNGLIGFRADIKDTDAEYERLREMSNTREHGE